jgi:hypothetical protein
MPARKLEYPQFIAKHYAAYRQRYKALKRALDGAYSKGATGAERKRIKGQFDAIDKLVGGLPPAGGILRLPDLRTAFAKWARARGGRLPRGDKDWAAQELRFALFSLDLYLDTICTAFRGKS